MKYSIFSSTHDTLLKKISWTRLILFNFRKVGHKVKYYKYMLNSKDERPTIMMEMRPISLCNVGYKIISKVLCQRLKVCLPKHISETQSAFVPRRLISDNILIAHKMFQFHGLRNNKSCQTKFMAIKMDMSKAYDKVE